MNELKRNAVLLKLISELKRNGSWCGETHIQKSTYFLQELCNIPTDFEFILYKHGPYSFDLSDEIFKLRANEYLDLIPQEPYGASLYPSKRCSELFKKFPKTIDKYESQINFIAKKLGKMQVAQLESLSTSLYVTIDEDIPKAKRARNITKLKSHISLEIAKSSLELLDEIVNESKKLKPFQD